MVQHLLVLADQLEQRAQLFCWRTHQGVEVGFVLTWGRKAIPMEVKPAANPPCDDARGLRAFIGEYGDAVPAAVLVHGGV